MCSPRAQRSQRGTPFSSYLPSHGSTTRVLGLHRRCKRASSWDQVTGGVDGAMTSAAIDQSIWRVVGNPLIAGAASGPLRRSRSQ